MIRRRRYFTALVALACTSAAWAQTPAAASTTSTIDVAADRAAVAQLERRWLPAVQPGGDRKALDAILANDYTDTDWQGRTRNKTQLIASPAAKGAVEHVTGLHVRVWGDTAVATGVNHVHSTTKGWTVEVPFTDVFARIDGRWRAVASQETLLKPATSAQSN